MAGELDEPVGEPRKGSRGSVGVMVRRWIVAGGERVAVCGVLVVLCVGERCEDAAETHREGLREEALEVRVAELRLGTTAGVLSISVPMTLVGAVSATGAVSGVTALGPSFPLSCLT